MINVAILDDEAVYLDKEKEITEAYFREKQEDCRVDTFQSIEWFVSGLKETCYDLFISWMWRCLERTDWKYPEKSGSFILNR